MIQVKRVYERPSEPDGLRILVDRLWPRGIAKARAPFGTWARELAPSPQLRIWYGHDPARFDEFTRRYRQELDGTLAQAGVAQLRRRARAGGLVLVTAARDLEHSAARVLGAVLREA